MTQNELKKIVEYDIESGVFTYLKSRKGGIKKGQIAGCKDKNGYIQVRINNVRYYCHRLAFLYMNGYIPEFEVDHINHNRSDNRWENLREVTSTENCKNIPLKSNNISGCMGVYFCNTFHKWVAKIQLNRKNIHLGYFIELHEAVNARKNAEVLYGFHENHGKPKGAL